MHKTGKSLAIIYDADVILMYIIQDAGAHIGKSVSS